MACSPFQNHYWHVALYVTARGLSTSVFRFEGRSYDVELDLLGHELVVRTGDGTRRAEPLRAGSVADIAARADALFDGVGLRPRIRPVPNEVDPAVPFAQDHAEREYDPEAATLFLGQLQVAHEALSVFRSGFDGKVSPVHFFWGSFDLAVTRFSGRPAPLHPGGVPNCPDEVMHESYNAELSSAGFWPGGGDEGAFYSYAYPEPAGFSAADVGPAGAHWFAPGGQFLLPYEAVRTAADPDAAVCEFLTGTFAAAARTADWPA